MEYVAKFARAISDAEAGRLAAELGARQIEGHCRSLAVRFGDRPYVDDDDCDLWIGIESELFLSFRSGPEARIEAVNRTVIETFRRLGMELELRLAD